MWFKKQAEQEIVVPTKDLQAELYSLCMRCIADQLVSKKNGDRYEQILRELYLRGETPCMTLKPKINNN